MPELPWQSSEAGIRRLKEVCILKGIYYRRPETPLSDYILQEYLADPFFTNALIIYTLCFLFVFLHTIIFKLCL